jgi:hypothetical protein
MVRDLLYGTLQHSVHTIMVREKSSPQEADIVTLPERVPATIRPAYGLTVSLPNRWSQADPAAN